MTLQQRRFAGAADNRSDDFAFPGANFINVSNALGGGDNSESTSSNSNRTESIGLAVDNFNFNIPADAVILGVELRVKIRQNNTNSHTVAFGTWMSQSSGKSAAIPAGGLPQDGADWKSTQNAASLTHAASSAWFTTGDALDLWNWTLTPAQVNADAFAFIASITWPNLGGGGYTANCLIDAFEAVIYYNLPEITHKFEIGPSTTTLDTVVRATTTKPLSGISTMEVELMVESDRITQESNLIDKAIRKYLPFDGGTIEFRGKIREVRIDPTNRHKMILRCRGDEDVLRDLDIRSYSAKQFGPAIIDTVTDGGALGFIGDADIVEPGGYGVDDHAVLQVPSTIEPANVKDDFNIGEKVGDSTCGAPTFTGTEAGINDQDVNTWLQFAKFCDPLAFVYAEVHGDSTNIKANVVNARLEYSFYLLSTQANNYQVVAKLQYNDAIGGWTTIDSRTLTVPLVNNYYSYTLSGYIDTNEFLDGADHFETRIRFEPVTANAHTINCRIYSGFMKIYTGTVAYSEFFQIDNYDDASGMNVSPVDLAAKGVAVGNTYEVGLKGSAAITALAALPDFAEALSFSIDVSALPVRYTSRDFSGLTMLEAIEYVVTKAQGQWYFDHNANTLFLVQESTITGGATAATVGESDIMDYDLQNKTLNKVRRVSGTGNKYLIVNDSDVTETKDITYVYPDDSEDNVSTEGLGFKNQKVNEPDINTWVELAAFCKNLFNKLNNQQKSVSFRSTYNENYILGNNLDLTFENKSFPNYPVFSVTTITEIADDLVTLDVTNGFQQTPQALRLAAHINRLKKEINSLFKQLRGAPTFTTTGSSSDHPKLHALSDGAAHSGQLADSQHLTAFLLDASRTITGITSLNEAGSNAIHIYFKHAGVRKAFLGIDSSARMQLFSDVSEVRLEAQTNIVMDATNIYMDVRGSWFYRDKDNADAVVLTIASATGDITLQSGSHNIQGDGDCVLKDGTFDSLSLGDNKQLKLGDGDDLIIFFNGSQVFFSSAGFSQEFDCANFAVDISNNFLIRDRDDANAILFNLDSGARTLAIGVAADLIATNIQGDLSIGTSKWATAATGRYWRFNSIDTAHIAIKMDSNAIIKGISIAQHATPLASPLRVTSSGGTQWFNIDKDGVLRVGAGLDWFWELDGDLTAKDIDATNINMVGLLEIILPDPSVFISMKDSDTNDKLDFRVDNTGKFILNIHDSSEAIDWNGIEFFPENGIVRFVQDVQFASGAIYKIDSTGKLFSAGAAIGDGGVTNYANIAADGEITLFGTARIIRTADIDITLPRRPTANPPAQGNEDGFDTLDFDDTTDESIFAEMHLHHDYAAAGLVHVHIEFFVDTAPAGASNVVWGVEYKQVSHGDNFDFGAGTSTVTVTEAITTGTPANDKKIHESAALALTTAGFAPDDTIFMRIYRDADNGADTFTGDARIIGKIHIEYLSDRLGEAT